MKSMRARRQGPLLAVCWTLGLAGCLSFGGPSPPIQYWILDSLPGPPATPAVERVVGVGPIALPAHLDRPNVTTRVDESRLVVSQNDLWAEPLVVGIQRVIAENLAVLNPGVKTITFPWSGPTTPELQVAVSVTRLDARPGGEVQLVAAWVLSQLAEHSELERGSSWIQIPVAGTSTGDVVTAISRAVEQLSRELAAAVERAPAT